MLINMYYENMSGIGLIGHHLLGQSTSGDRAQNFVDAPEILNEIPSSPVHATLCRSCTHWDGVDGDHTQVHVTPPASRQAVITTATVALKPSVQLLMYPNSPQFSGKWLSYEGYAPSTAELLNDTHS